MTKTHWRGIPITWEPIGTISYQQGEIHEPVVAQAMRAIGEHWDVDVVPPVRGFIYESVSGKKEVPLHDGHHRVEGAKRNGLRLVPVLNESAMRRSEKASYAAAIKRYRALTGHPLAKGGGGARLVAGGNATAPRGSAMEASFFVAGRSGVYVEHPAGQYGKLVRLFASMPPERATLERVTEELHKLGGRFVPYADGAPGDNAYRPEWADGSFLDGLRGRVSKAELAQAWWNVRAPGYASGRAPVAPQATSPTRPHPWSRVPKDPELKWLVGVPGESRGRARFDTFEGALRAAEELARREAVVVDVLPLVFDDRAAALLLGADELRRFHRDPDGYDFGKVQVAPGR